MRLFVFLTLFFCSLSVKAVCPGADALMKKGETMAALRLYESCALKFNDDASQILLAQAYRAGKDGVPQNDRKALLFYHLSSDNGNATAQTEMAQWLLSLDETPEGRSFLQSYLTTVQSRLAGEELFRGELLHPYTLLLLAAEKENAKWYYPSRQRTDSRAAPLVRRYDVSDEKKAQAVRDATVWKNRKMKQAARSLWDDKTYQAFINRVFPAHGKADPFQRTQALDQLREAVMRHDQAYFGDQK